MREHFDFFRRVRGFNKMYGLSAPGVPTYSHDLKARLLQFKKILQAEVDEVDLIVAKMDGEVNVGVADEIMVDLGDWLGDIVVYATSEAVRHGIPMENVLEIIMESNDSKLDAEGNPIIKDGKVQKGPHYWKPEPKIAELFVALARANEPKEYKA